MGASNRFFPSVSNGVILFSQQRHLRWNFDSSPGKTYNLVQFIQFEGKTAVAIPKLIQGIYIS
jgi:hypothetical protein